MTIQWKASEQYFQVMVPYFLVSNLKQCHSFPQKRQFLLTSATLAKSNGISSSQFCIVVSAPAATNRAVWPLSPRPAATCSGVFPSSVTALTSQFACKNQSHDTISFTSIVSKYKFSSLLTPCISYSSSKKTVKISRELILGDDLLNSQDLGD